MNFIETIITLFYNLGEFIGDLFNGFIEFLTIPFALLLSLLEGIFYFIIQFFEVVVLLITLFVSLFQMFFSFVGAFFRTIYAWVGFSPSGSVNLPSWSRQGFETVLEQIGGTGLLTVIPNVLTAILWILVIYKIIGLVGGKGETKKT